MEAELKSLRIDRSRSREPEPSKWATRWIIIGVLVFVALGVGRFAYTKLNASTPVEIVRVQAARVGAGSAAPEAVILNATGYIVAHHAIQVAAKVIGRVSWIGVEKGDRVNQGQVVARLEDDEYRAQVQQAKGNLQALQAKLAEAEHGSRPEEISVAEANWNQAKADLENARVTLDRYKELSSQGVVSRQSYDDAVAKYDNARAKVDAYRKTLDLAKLGPRIEQIDALRGQVEQARGSLAYAETQLANTLIKAPVTGTILERAVEKGEFITTSFVGDKGAKGYVVSEADLNDLQVELDIAQNDFAKLHMRQRGIITTDAFPDRKYNGEIEEMSPEANRQKATVQIKVKVLNPDSYLRPEMNASVSFLSDAKSETPNGAALEPLIFVPTSAVKGDSVFVVLDGRAVKRNIKRGPTSSSGVQIKQGLVGGEDLIVNPPAELKDGSRVQQKS
jgi:HlyD family secretion protein